jgi:hypothetical protein
MMAYTPHPSVVTGQTWSAANQNTYVKGNIEYLKDAIDNFEPIKIGGLYFSAVSTNPATLLGYGTWTVVSAGRTIVGYNASDPDFDTVEKTGGEKTHANTADENGPHTHSYTKRAGNQNVDSGAQLAAYYTEGSATTGSSGLGTPHNNLQPYTVYWIWKRTG